MLESGASVGSKAPESRWKANGAGSPSFLQPCHAVWFKNRRAKLKKAKCKHPEPKEETPEPLGPEGGVSTSVGRRDADALPRLPSTARPIGLVYTGHRVPSFQLIAYPNLKVPAHELLGHRMVHFGCCQDPNIYFLYPIVEPQAYAPSSSSASPACSSLQSRER
ncbi:divergent paired-related homeobox-like [Cebus imitator]|uniref:divergent paired-related homeobox-like n=1 Tax=Cebus imitator TaxID=2715852 RepID=UPI001897A8F2|nr:divergent paired-related homeobox-like [Cebus imitator]